MQHKKYTHILNYLERTPLAIDPRKLTAIHEFIEGRVATGGLPVVGFDDEPRAAKPTKSLAKRQGEVAVIPVRGLISQRDGMDWEASAPVIGTETIGASIQGAVNDESVKAIVLEIDSPGGSVYGVAELADLIFAARGTKPIVAAVNSLAASAAYWIAASADEIAVTPSGEVGSIGVYTIHWDQSLLLAAKGVTPTIIQAGKFKTEGNPYQPLSVDALAAVQADIDHFYEMFISAVARGRRTSVSKVRLGFGQGRTLVAPEAVAAGMADRVETLAQTLARLGVSKTQSSSRKSEEAAGFSLAECEHDYFLTTNPIE